MEIVLVNEICKTKLTTGKVMKDFVLKIETLLNTDEEILLDFTGVTFGDITTDDEFKRLLIDKRFNKVKLKFYNQDSIVQICKLFLHLAGGDENKVENVVSKVNVTYQTTEEVYQPSKKSKRLTNLFLSKAFEVDEEHNKVILYYHQTKKGEYVLNDVNTKDAVIAIRDALLIKLQETGYVNAVVDFGTMTVFTNRSDVIASAFCNLFTSIMNKGYEVELKLSNEEDRRLLEQMYEIPNMSKDENEILDKIDTYLNIGTIGLLSEYVPNESKKDKFGHYGKGEIATRQPAMYMGREDTILKFRVFDAHTFLRRIDWIVRQEEESTHSSLNSNNNKNKSFEFKYKDLEIELSTIGICKFCDGSRYYFSLAIQTKDDEFLETHYKNEDGSYGVVKVILPQYIEMVLKEQGYEYDMNNMLLCISETRKSLEQEHIVIDDLSCYNLNEI